MARWTYPSLGQCTTSHGRGHVVFVWVAEWTIMQFFTTILTRQTCADYEACRGFYDFKLLQNNPTLPHNQMVKQFISYIYIIGVRRAESF